LLFQDGVAGITQPTQWQGVPCKLKNLLRRAGSGWPIAGAIAAVMMTVAWIGLLAWALVSAATYLFF
jgi:hypothetical protein